MSVSLHKELKYGSEGHEKIKKAVLARFRLSHNNLTDRAKQWDKADKLYRAYHTKTEDDRVRSARRKGGTVEYTTVTLPFSYALLLTAHTYWTSVFLARDPVLQFTARHGEPAHKVQAVEAIIDYQLRVGGMLVPLYQWLLDAGRYGYGVVGAYWCEEYSTTSQIVEEDESFSLLGFNIPGGKKRKVRKYQRALSYNGNRLFNIRPHDFYYDPRVSLASFQSGEFCGRFVEIGWNTLKASSEGYFNLEQVRKKDNNTQYNRIRPHRELVIPNEDSLPAPSSDMRNDMYSLIEMTWELIPNEWGLGESTYPEKWVITMANEDVIIGCRPQTCIHNQFPFCLQLYEVDGYSNNSRGMLEIVEPLSDTLDWLFNSHFFNVRKSLNDQILYDPSRVETADLERGGAGRLIRLKPAAYGANLDQVLKQLPVVNVTQQNFRNIAALLDMFYRVTGINDNLMGLVNAGGRKTATEVRTSSSFGVNRLKTFCEYNSGLGWSPMSQILLQNSQQFYDEPQMYKIAGDLLQQKQGFLSIGPEELAGFYDFVPVDGTLPIDRFAQANLWKEILTGMATIPQIGQGYDIAGIFSWMAQLAGLKNITQFRIEVAPDQMLQNQIEQGRMVPASNAAIPGSSGGPVPPQAGSLGPVA